MMCLTIAYRVAKRVPTRTDGTSRWQIDPTSAVVQMPHYRRSESPVSTLNIPLLPWALIITHLHLTRFIFFYYLLGIPLTMLASRFFAFFTAVAAVTSAAPSFKTRCNTSRDTLPMPSTANSTNTPLVLPPAGSPSFIGVGVGVQNYTCATTGTYSSTGAVAELFDVSCLPEPIFSTITNLAYMAWKAAPKSMTALSLVNTLAAMKPAVVLGQHYFVVNPLTGSGLSPKWDFTSASEAGHADAFVVAAKTGDVPAPSDPKTNVDWLSLKGVQGNLASSIYRVDTRGGQPPASCTPGSADISVRYASLYVLYGGSY